MRNQVATAANATKFGCAWTRTVRPALRTAPRFAVKASPTAALSERVADFVFEPRRDGDGQVEGVFVVGAAQARPATLTDVVGAGKTAGAPTVR